MKQEYVLLRTENDLLNSLIGQSFNQRTKFEAYKILTEIHSKAQDRSIGKMALCYIVDKNEIKGVGGSTLMKDKNGKIISNLILDQFGKWLTTIFTIVSLTDRPVSIKATTGVLEALNIYDNSAFFNDRTGGSIGVNLAVGSGITAPLRTDFKIETAFATAPESSNFNLGSNPVYNSGLGNFKPVGTISAGGSGTINESVLFAVWIRNLGGVKTFALFRDIISPAQSFIAGQTIALEYTIQL